MGPRVPAADASRREFRLGVFLLHEDGRPPRAELLDRTQALARPRFPITSLRRPAAACGWFRQFRQRWKLRANSSSFRSTTRIDASVLVITDRHQHHRDGPHSTGLPGNDIGFHTGWIRELRGLRGLTDCDFVDVVGILDGQGNTARIGSNRRGTRRDSSAAVVSVLLRFLLKMPIGLDNSTRCGAGRGDGQPALQAKAGAVGQTADGMARDRTSLLATDGFRSAPH